MTVRDGNERNEQDRASSHEGEGHSTTPQVQTPEKPSQAEGDRETIDADLEEKEAASGS